MAPKYDPNVCPPVEIGSLVKRWGTLYEVVDRHNYDPEAFELLRVQDALRGEMSSKSQYPRLEVVQRLADGIRIYTKKNEKGKPRKQQSMKIDHWERATIEDILFHKNNLIKSHQKLMAQFDELIKDFS